MGLKRVVVTGMGTINPIGKNYKEFWRNLKKGTSGAKTITQFDTTAYKTKFACSIDGYKAEDYFDRKTARKLDKFVQYALIAADETLKNAALDLNAVNEKRVGVITGVGIGGLDTLTDELTQFGVNNRVPRFSPFFIPKMIANIAGGHISIKYGFKGPNFTTVSACTSSAHALIEAYHYLQLNKADVILAGGAESAVNQTGIGGFNALRALSLRNDDPATASRPFDANRDGFVLGEGAGMLLLETLEHAQQRKANIYTEIVGAGANCDAFHTTAPHPEGEGAKDVMGLAIEDAQISPTDIDHINTHGTSTELGDIAEVNAIQEVFGQRAYNININSTKSMTGHLLGAAGAVESIACIFAINKDIIPPTINHFNLDERFDKNLNFTFNEAQEKKVNYALSNTFGFGGHNASIIFKKYRP